MSKPTFSPRLALTFLSRLNAFADLNLNWAAHSTNDLVTHDHMGGVKFELTSGELEVSVAGMCQHSCSPDQCFLSGISAVVKRVLGGLVIYET